MKACIKCENLLFKLVVILGAALVGKLPAQTFTTLHSFIYNTDGDGPFAGLILCGNTLYGTANGGGTLGGGTVFSVNTNGSSFSILHGFGSLFTEGINPTASLVLSENTLYGTTAYGGTDSGAGGTVFAVNTNGSGFRTLYKFSTPTNTGRVPSAGLVLSGNTLYGITRVGGNSDNGTVFAIKTDGSGFTNLHIFAATATNSLGQYTNSDGANPLYGNLVLSQSMLYGTASGGGTSGNGTVFALNTDGSGFRTLYSFSTAETNNSGLYTNSDGANPYTGLVLFGSSLFGTTISGGSSGNGTVFRLNVDGSGFTTLHHFASIPLRPGYYATSLPTSQLALAGGTLYGTTVTGGGPRNGTVFAVDTDGSRFRTLYSFSAAPANTNSDGINPYVYSGLVLAGNFLYGTAWGGGTSECGTIFNILLPPSGPLLTITPAGANIILSWSTNATGFGLQSTADLFSPAWITNSSIPAIVKGVNTVTIPISGSQQYYRLSQ